MRSLSTALATSLQDDAHGDLALLVEIALPDGTIYRTSWNEDVSYGGNTYVADAVSWGEIRATTLQENPTVDLRLQNIKHPTTSASRPWSTVLAAVTESSNVNASAVTWRIIDVSLAEVVSEENWALNRPSLRDNDVHFSVGPNYNIYQLQTPAPPLKAPRCRFQFKDADCASQAATSVCPGKTLADCVARHPETAARISQIPFHDARLTRL